VFLYFFLNWLELVCFFILKKSKRGSVFYIKMTKIRLIKFSLKNVIELMNLVLWSWSQTCAASHQVKSTQSHDLTFFSNSQKSQRHDFDFDLTFWLFSLFFRFFLRYFDSKKGSNCPKMSFFWLFFKFLKKSKAWLDLTWLDFFLKKWLSAQVWLNYSLKFLHIQHT
jgi:hypothetical protein